jgi:hypothetical protein
MRIGRRQGCGINSIDRGHPGKFRAYGLVLFLNDGLWVGNPITQWTDLSGAAHHTSTVTSGGATPSAVGPNGRWMAVFSGGYLNFAASAFTTANVAECQIVFRHTAVTGAYGVDAFGTSGSALNVPFSGNNNIYDDWCSSVRKVTGVVPVPSPVNEFISYGRVSRAGEWTAFINGLQIYTTATNTMGVPATTRVGYSLYGDMCRYVIYSSKLSVNARRRRARCDGALYGFPVAV